MLSAFAIKKREEARVPLYCDRRFVSNWNVKKDLKPEATEEAQ